MNLLDFFDAGVASHPNAPCFVDCGRDAPAITYAQAGALTCQIARGLQALGVAPGFHGAVLSGTVEPQALIQFVKDRLDSVKAPKDVEIVEQLPRSAVGKVLKKEVRKKYWHAQERMVS